MSDLESYGLEEEKFELDREFPGDLSFSMLIFVEREGVVNFEPRFTLLLLLVELDPAPPDPFSDDISEIFHTFRLPSNEPVYSRPSVIFNLIKP
jgi:hypothetical protein